MKRTSFEGNPCPIAQSLDVIGDWWSLLIIRAGLTGARRFGEFQRELGLAKNILSARLRMLAAHGLIEAKPAADGGAHQEYLLTAKGRGLFHTLVALRQWSEEFLIDPDEPHSQLLERATGEPVGRLQLHARDGRVLEAADTMVKRVS